MSLYGICTWRAVIVMSNDVWAKKLNEKKNRTKTFVAQRVSLVLLRKHVVVWCTHELLLCETSKKRKKPMLPVEESRRGCLGASVRIYSASTNVFLLIISTVACAYQCKSRLFYCIIAVVFLSALCAFDP